MSKLLDVEAKLLQLEGGPFQVLADEFFYKLHGGGLAAYERAGSKPGTQKVRSGTPDSYALLPDGTCKLVEFTTQAEGLCQKLLADIEKCLDPQKTGIPVQRVSQITLIHTSSLKPSEFEILRKRCDEASVTLDVFGLNRLALELVDRFPELALDHLGIQCSTLQIQTLAQFVTEREGKLNISSDSYSNLFQYRTSDLEALLTSLETYPVTVLTGSQGVGKTRLAVEVLSKYTALHPDVTAYCVTNRGVLIYDDLYAHIKLGGKYVLLFDDANRQTELLVSTLHHLSAREQVTFTLLLTVRDYAFDRLRPYLHTYRWGSISLVKFTDEEIKGLVGAPPFEIGHQSYLTRIQAIANGNPRLAVLAAHEAKKAGHFLQLENVSDLYQSFYGDLVDENNEPLLSTIPRLRILGLLAAFRVIDLDDSAFLEKLYEAFGSNWQEVANGLRELEQLELADAFSDSGHAYRIADQNLGQYAFYQAFLVTRYLNLETLLTHFFEEFARRLRDVLFGVINGYNHAEVIEKISPAVREYHLKIRNSQELLFPFFEVFYAVLPLETMTYLHDFAQLLGTEFNPQNKEQLDSRLFINETLDRHLQILAPFLDGENQYFTLALEVAALIASRGDEPMKAVIKMLENAQGIVLDDLYIEPLRQRFFLESLAEKTDAENPAHRALFYGLLPYFFQTVYQSNTFRKNVMMLNRVRLPLDDQIREFRKWLWQELLLQARHQPEAGRKVLRTYGTIGLSVLGDNRPVSQFDVPFLCQAIRQILSPNDFTDCHWVNQLAKRFSTAKIRAPKLQELALEYQSQLYQGYLLMNWNVFRKRDAYLKALNNPDAYLRQKSAELRQNVPLASLEDVEKLIETLKALYNQSEITHIAYEQTMSVVMRELKQKNPALFEQAFNRIINTDWPITFNAVYFLQLLFADGIEPAMYLSISQTHYNRSTWQRGFFHSLKKENVTPELVEKLIEWHQTLPVSKEGTNIHSRIWAKFEWQHPTIYLNILQILVGRYETEGLRYFLDYNFFKDNFERFEAEDVTLLRIAFLQQMTLHRDQPQYNFREELPVFLQRDPAFLFEYLNAKYTLVNSPWHHPHLEALKVIWTLPNSVEWAMRVVQFMADTNRTDHSTSHFEDLLGNVGEERQPAILEFLNRFVDEYSHQPKQILAMVQALHHLGRNDHYLRVLQQFLKINSSFKDFSVIGFYWIDNSYSGPADVNVAELKAERWRSVLDEVVKMPNPLAYLKHRTYAESEIDRYREDARQERRRMFMRGD